MINSVIGLVLPCGPSVCDNRFAKHWSAVRFCASHHAFASSAVEKGMPTMVTQ